MATTTLLSSRFERKPLSLPLVHPLGQLRGIEAVLLQQPSGRDGSVRGLAYGHHGCRWIEAHRSELSLERLNGNVKCARDVSIVELGLGPDVDQMDRFVAWSRSCKSRASTSWTLPKGHHQGTRWSFRSSRSGSSAITKASSPGYVALRPPPAPSSKIMPYKRAAVLALQRFIPSRSRRRAPHRRCEQTSPQTCPRLGEGTGLFAVRLSTRAFR